MAEHAGYNLDFFPLGREGSSYEDWRSEVSPNAQAIDMSAYDLFNNGARQQREPSDEDPYVLVDRFADSLPAELYSEDFLAILGQRFPFQPQASGLDAQRQYINCLGFVEGCLKEWFPYAVAPSYDQM
jgi:hypothetical protein